MNRVCGLKKIELGGTSNKATNDGGGAKSKEIAVDQWLDLPSGPLDEIFTKLNFIDIILVVPLVCRYWGQILLKKLSFIKNNDSCLDFTPLLSEPFYSFFYQLGDENVGAKRLMLLIIGIMHSFASGNENDAQNGVVMRTSITDIKLCSALPFHDRHLVYIAKRCPDLRSISLPCSKNITGQGISRAMRCWSYMERMVYGPINDLHLTRTIEEIGVNCKNLQSISLTDFEFHWQAAELIVRNMKSLKTLTLCHAEISKYGLHIFLSRWKKPIVMYLDFCYCTSNKKKDEKHHFMIWNIQEDRRIKWMTDIFDDEMGKVYSSKELTNLIWKLKR